MDNLLEVYSKIKLLTNNEIVVTYYTKYGVRHVKKYKLIMILDFTYLYLESDEDLIVIPFFSKDTMIESIKLDDDSQEIYYNPYVSNDIYDGEYIKEDCLKDIKSHILGSEEFDSSEADVLLESYLGRNILKYEDLFFTSKQKLDFESFFSSLIEKLRLYCRNNGLDTEIKFLTSGTTSVVFEMGDKIIKIGKPRSKNCIPYFENLLQPMINRIYQFDGYPMHIEVTQKVLVLDNKDGLASLSNDERFNDIVDSLSEFLYSIGIQSNDLHPGNVGVLLNDNKVFFNDNDYCCFNEKLTSILYNNGLKILEKGNSVIIDLDDIYIYDIDKYINYLISIGYDKNCLMLSNHSYGRKLLKK